MRRALAFVIVIACGAPATRSVAPPIAEDLGVDCDGGCAPKPPREAQPAALRSAVFDLHVDLPYQLHVHHRPLDETQASPARLARGGVSVIVTPMFVLNAFSMPPADVRAAYEATYVDLLGVAPRLGVATWISFEGMDGFVDDPHALEAWMARGACLFSLVHDHSNALGGASQDPSPEARARGLTAIGKRIAAEIVARGGLLDVAHASDATFDDLAAIGATLVDSHTGMRALRDTMRNINDRELAVVARSGGIIGVSMHGGHVGKIPGEPPTLDDVADHVMHAVAIAGIDHVAIGSDFDGGITAPREADGESVWPAFRTKLAARGLDAHAIDAIYSRNARRVFAQCKNKN